MAPQGTVRIDRLTNAFASKGQEFRSRVDARELFQLQTNAPEVMVYTSARVGCARASIGALYYIPCIGEVRCKVTKHGVQVDGALSVLSAHTLIARTSVAAMHEYLDQASVVLKRHGVFGEASFSATLRVIVLGGKRP